MDTLSYIVEKYGLTIDDSTHMPIRIPRVGRNDILQWVHDLNFTKGVEVGVAEGEFSKLIVEKNPQLTLYGIDPWAPYKGYTDYRKTSTFSTLFEKANQALQPYIDSGQYEIVKEFSMDALQKFDDNSLDFVYIDANHRDPYITEDISGWFTKIKPGGILAGHDYIDLPHCDVIAAVNRFTRARTIHPWFVVEADEYPSWVIII